MSVHRILTVAMTLAALALDVALTLSFPPTTFTRSLRSDNVVDLHRLHLFSRIIALNAKPKQKLPYPPLVTQESATLDAIPANLRRKVRAKRPTLGHIVPKVVRDRQKKEGGSNAPQLQRQGQIRNENDNNPSMLKVMGGSCRGRRLDSPSAVYLRPMMGKVKEAVFSTLSSFGLYDGSARLRHLDIYAGSGSVGIESLSRGATHCTFVDLSQDCCRCIEANIKKLDRSLADARTEGQHEQPRVVCADAMAALTIPHTALGLSSSPNNTYDLITLCPPYEEVVYGDLLEAAVGSDIVAEDTVILVEYPVELGTLPHVVTARNNTAVGLRNRRYGRTVIALYVVNPTGRLSDAATSRPEEFVEL